MVGGQRGYGNAGRAAYSGGTAGSQSRAVFAAGGVTPPVPTSPPSLFYPAAARLLAGSQSPAAQQPLLDTSVVVEIGAAGRASPVSGRANNAAPQLSQNDVSSGTTTPTVTKNRGLYMTANRTDGSRLYGRCGAYCGYVNGGDRFDFRLATNTGRATDAGFHVFFRPTQGSGRWRRATANQSLVPLGSDVYYPQVIFPSSGDWEFMVLCDEATAIYGFNFPTGASYVAPVINWPRIWVGPDSYWFGQGADNPWLTMAIQLGLKMGALGVFNHGLRANGWDELDTANNAPDFGARLNWPGWEELLLWGPVDLYGGTDTVNDGARPYSTLFPKMRDGMAVFKAAMQRYGALYFFVQGYKPPQYGYTLDQWNAGQDAFKANFGATRAEQEANGAILLDCSKYGTQVAVPDGAAGSSIEFPATGDVDHPNETGHQAHATRIWTQALQPALQRIVADNAGKAAAYRTTASGDFRTTSSGELRSIA